LITVESSTSSCQTYHQINSISYRHVRELNSPVNPTPHSHNHEPESNLGELRSKSSGKRVGIRSNHLKEEHILKNIALPSLSLSCFDT